MKKVKSALVLMITALFIFSGSIIFAETLVISGTINGDYQLVSDTGQVYEIGENQKGEELMEMEGMKVEVKGTVEKSESDEETLVLIVTEFKVKG